MSDYEPWWPCACMKRKGGDLTHIRLNPPETLACEKCGATKPADQVEVPASPSPTGAP